MKKWIRVTFGTREERSQMHLAEITHDGWAQIKPVGARLDRQLRVSEISPHFWVPVPALELLAREAE